MPRLPGQVKTTPIESAESPTPQLKMLGIADIIQSLGRMIPEEELRIIPKDLGGQVDHYVYGTPKR
jgi:hypothetical protein